MIRSAVLRAVAGAILAMGLLPAMAGAQITASPRYSGIVVDARTGNVLIAEAADELRHPASLTKMMTLYMLFEAMRGGRFTLDTPIYVSGWAASQQPSKLGVPAGGAVSTENAILALVTRSANDIAVAVGEALGGDEANFARMMTQRARSLGMSRTTFRNASGLPDPEQVTTARDMTLLGRRLIQDFPDQYRYFSLTHFVHGNRIIRNHNGMLRDYPGADGIKTGYITASGYNIVTSAQREGVRLVGAVFGGNSWAQRNDRMAELLDAGFARLGVREVPPLVASAPPPRMAVARHDATVGPGPRRAATIRQAALREPPRGRTRGVSRAVGARPEMVAARPGMAAPRQAMARVRTVAAPVPAIREASRAPRSRPLPAARREPAAPSRTRATQAAPRTRAAEAAPRAPSREALPPRQQLARNSSRNPG